MKMTFQRVIIDVLPPVLERFEQREVSLLVGGKRRRAARKAVKLQPRASQRAAGYLRFTGWVLAAAHVHIRLRVREPSKNQPSVPR